MDKDKTMDSNVIDHEQAIREMMVERYLLDELRPQQRDAFEAHLFDCSACFEQVRAGTEFVHCVREIGVEGVPAPPQPGTGGWRRFFGGMDQPVPALAAILLVAAIGFNVYQHQLLSRQKGPRLEWSYTLTGIAHGGGPGQNIEVPRGAVLGLSVEYQRRGELTSYGVRILSDSGEVRASLPILHDQGDGMAKIMVSSDFLEPGRYSVVVWGRTNDGNETEVGHGAFELQFSR
jgi:putative zinc finger protein